MKYYVVWEGVNPGIYNTWEECKANITGFPNARYKSFKTKQEAIDAYRKGFISSTPSKSKSLPSSPRSNIIQKSISVDAARSGNPGDMEYRGVVTSSGKEIFKMGVFKQGTNNIGEFLAIVHGLAYLKAKKRQDIAIYTDSKTAMAWVRNKKANTKLKKTAANTELFELITRAEKWLHQNAYSNAIIKWETKAWGEIPADFGRK